MKRNWIFKLLPYFFVFVFLVIIAWWLFIGLLATKVVKEASQNGLKSVIERVWEGPDKGRP